MKYKHSTNYYDTRYAKYELTMKGLGLTPVSKGNFISLYEQLAGDTKHPTKNPMKDIIYSARYATKYNTAIAEKKALDKLGIKVKLDDLKNMTTTDFASKYASQLADAYRELRKAGTTGKAAALLISQQWFGSN